MNKFTVLDLLNLDLREHDALDLRCIAGRPGLVRVIEIPDINRPGLALSGFFDNFAFQRIQLFGRGEYAYLVKLFEENSIASVERFFRNEMPCVIFSHSLQPNDVFTKICGDSGCPLLQTSLPTSDFATRIMRALSNVFAPKETRHGVLVEVFGVGVLILGDSGVGKSEAALELIERGHRLVADDAVEIRCVSGNILLGAGANRIIGHHMEIRGLGVINVTHLYGVSAIRDEKTIQLVVELENWETDKNYDRLGDHEVTTEILGVQIPYLMIPVKPGRNIPILIETAAKNERLKEMGYFSAKEFNKSVLKWLESENARTVYLQNSSL
ncbi:MAG: HPr(Ser) kinase/phosphatase [Spirochaetales bacterium]|jgi:HPr kinase/phosphorylase|nr:HPr(Ser) kinase/phosphatase [Spirochaetales bacterium]